LKVDVFPSDRYGEVEIPVETVRQWGGWKSLETMLRYLADVNVKDSVNAMKQAAKRLATA
jgi:hypothetical protein